MVTAEKNERNIHTFNKHIIIILIATCVYLLFFEIIGIKSTFSFDYDEGVYYQTALQHAHGQRLYSALFLSQPPLLIELLSLLINLFGNSVVLMRSVSITFGLLIVLGTFFVANELFDRSSALLSLIILGLNYYFMRWMREHPTIIPSVALALCTIYAAIRYNKTRQLKWVIVSACAFTLMNGFKLTQPFLIFPVLFLFSAPPITKNKIVLDEFKFASIIRAFLFYLIVLMATSIVIFIHYDLPSLKSQVFGLGTQQLFNISLYKIGSRIGEVYLTKEIGLFLLTVLGLIRLYTDKRAIFLLFIIWITTQLMFHILMSSWLWANHLLSLIPVFSIISAARLNRSLLDISEKSQIGTVPVRKQLKHLFVRIIIAISVILIPMQNIYNSTRYMKNYVFGGYTPEEKELVDIVTNHTTMEDLIVSDVQMATFLTNRLTLPELVDTSAKRIKTGNLLDSFVISNTKDAKLVIFWAQKLVLLEEYYNYIREHYRLIYSKPGKEVYLKE